MQSAETDITSLPLDGSLKKSTLKRNRDYEDLPEEIRLALLARQNKKQAEETTLSRLDRRYMMTVLVYLNHNRPALKSDIHSDISRNASMAERMDALVDMGLVRVYQTVRYNSQYIVLTPKGQRIARMIEEMIDIIDNAPDDVDEYGVKRT